MAKFLLQNTVVIKMIGQTIKDNPEGYILFEYGDEWKKLFFKNGYLTGSSSSNRADGTVHYLISQGIINDALIEEAIETGFDLQNIISTAIKSANQDILRHIVMEKIIDTIFIVSRWPECVYSIINENPSEIQEIYIELDISDISRELKKSIAEFEKIIDSIPKLGARPKINQKKKMHFKMNSFDELVFDHISSGKTISEILSLMTPHNYFILKCLYKLYESEIITKGTGAPLSGDDIITLVNESPKCGKCIRDTTADFTLKALLEQSTQDGNKCRKRTAT